MIETTVRFLLLEPDPASAQRVRDGFWKLKIANPLGVVHSLAELAASLSSSVAGFGEVVLLLGPSLWPDEAALVLDLVDAAPARPLATILLDVEAEAAELRAWPIPRSMDDPGVPLPQLPRLLDRLAMVVVTTVSQPEPVLLA